ncbi:MAG: tetratricopeptide repeat protein [Gammaproteobacteria bacterium]|nr:tetratricopeptide repeat protein [Gammaproteobacteria bacterium]
MMNTSNNARRSAPNVISPRFRWLLAAVLFLFSLLVVNSIYLSTITAVEFYSEQIYQDYFYLLMFLLHLLLGLLLVLPFCLFAFLHARRALRRDNRYAIRAGIALFISGLLLLISGIVLTRFGFFEINDPRIREPLYWLHVALPFVIAWLFVLHRLAGRPIRFRLAYRWLALAGGFAAVMLSVHLLTREDASIAQSHDFSPSNVKIAGGEFIAAEHLMTDQECKQCHEDIFHSWEHSMHRHSSFTNPAYRASVEETRKVVQERDGNLEASRFCAGCHDTVPLLGGRFERADFDPDTDATAMAGLTCTSCHAITAVNTTRGNSDFTIAAPARYPFALAEVKLLKAINHQLIKAKPAFHKHTLLKPDHKTAEFCSGCHKAHLPYQVNHYKWLRAQNHYDSFLQSGVSGHRVDSFYYPQQAVEKCAACHMPLLESDDPAARDFDGSGRLTIHSHLFPAANTAIPAMLGLDHEIIDAHQERLSNVTRVDIFGLKENADVQGTLHAPLDSVVPLLQPGRSYLIETVIRTLGVGHHLTQGTSDSNQLWLDVAIYDDDRLIARSGGMNTDDEVDPWSYFLNAYVLDRNGQRINRRNGQDIFVPLYDHQIPPGAADLVHYKITLPDQIKGPLTIEAKLKYRKFDNEYLRFIQQEEFDGNDLPVTIMATDRVVLPIAGGPTVSHDSASAVAEWERWNDYGIGLLREGNSGASKGELRQAEQVFTRVETMNPGQGALNLARVYFKEGRLDEASAAIHRAALASPAAPPWTLAWFSARIDHENGYLDNAIASLERIVDNQFEDARARGFDFSYDVNLLNELGRTHFERARMERGSKRSEQRQRFLQKSRAWFKSTLQIDPENQTAHFNLALVYAELGESDLAIHHRQLHERYRPDDYAIEVAVTRHRQNNPAADHAASTFAIYDLNRPQAYGMDTSTTPTVAQSASSYEQE